MEIGERGRVFALLTSSFPFGNGETFILDILDEVKASNHSVILITMWPRGQARYLNTLSNITHISLSPLKVNPFSLLSYLVKTLFYQAKPGALTHAQWFYRVLRESFAHGMGAQLAKIICQFRINHIHAVWASGTSSAANNAARISNVSWSFSGHSGDLIESVDLRKKVENASGVRVISERGMSFLTACGITSQKIRNIHLGVKYNKTLIKAPLSDSKDIRIACVGNLLPIKGHRYLIAALKELVSENFEISLAVIGSGPELKKLQNQVKEEKLEKYISFIPSVPRMEILESFEMGLYNLVVLPSVKSATNQEEGIPVSLMEAMSFGIIVISTQTGGVIELLGEFPNLMVPPEDSLSLKNAIIKISRLSNLERENLSNDLRKKIFHDFNSRTQSKLFFDWLEQISS